MSFTNGPTSRGPMLIFGTYTFPSSLNPSGNFAVDTILAEIPLFAIGLLAFGVFTFFLAVKRVNSLVLWIFSSALLAFVAAILDLLQLLTRGREADPTTGIDSVRIIIYGREVTLALSITFRYMFFWHFVAVRPRGDPIHPNPGDDQNDTGTISTVEGEIHRGSWSRWGSIGKYMKTGSLIVIIIILIMQILWRVVNSLNKQGPVHIVSNVLEIGTSGLFIVKIMLNVCGSPSVPFRKGLVPYIAPIVALLCGISVCASNLVFFAFSESTPGRFTQAVGLYILIVFILVFVFKRESGSRRSSVASGLTANGLNGYRSISGDREQQPASGLKRKISAPKPIVIMGSRRSSNSPPLQDGSRASSWMFTNNPRSALKGSRLGASNNASTSNGSVRGGTPADEKLIPSPALRNLGKPASGPPSVVSRGPGPKRVKPPPIIEVKSTEKQSVMSSKLDRESVSEEGESGSADGIGSEGEDVDEESGSVEGRGSKKSRRSRKMSGSAKGGDSSGSGTAKPIELQTDTPIQSMMTSHESSYSLMSYYHTSMPEVPPLPQTGSAIRQAVVQSTADDTDLEYHDSAPAKVTQPSISTRGAITSLDELLRQQSELEESLSNLRLPLSHDTGTPRISPSGASASTTLPRRRMRRPRSDDSVVSGRSQILRELAQDRLLLRRSSFKDSRPVTGPTSPVTQSDDFVPAIPGRKRGFISDSAGTQYDVTSFIGDLSVPVPSTKTSFAGHRTSLSDVISEDEPLPPIRPPLPAATPAAITANTTATTATITTTARWRLPAAIRGPAAGNPRSPPPTYPLPPTPSIALVSQPPAAHASSSLLPITGTSPRSPLGSGSLSGRAGVGAGVRRFPTIPAGKGSLGSTLANRLIGDPVPVDGAQPTAWERPRPAPRTSTTFPKTK